MLSAYSPKALRYFPRILHIRRKNEEYAEINFYFQQHLASLKGQSFEKIEWGLYTGLGRKNLQKNFLIIFPKKFLSAYMENTRKGKKRHKIVNISINN